MNDNNAMKCTWLDACQATDWVLRHFGNPKKDRGIWVWYCRRIGVEKFLDLADMILSCARQGEIDSPIRAFQKNLMEIYPKTKGTRT